MNPAPTPTPATPAVAAAMCRLALTLAAFLAAATLPYAWLIEHFGYDDILREPAAIVLQRFHEGGPALVLAWFAFATSALLFIAVVHGFERLLQATDTFGAHRRAGNLAAVLGIASALAQTIGLLRWVLVVPGLAAVHADPATSPAAREATLIVFDAVHRYGGMVLGELVGQLLLAAWTASVALRLLRARLVPRWLAAVGLLTLPLWLLGQTELLHGVVPAIPALEVIPLAFMGWEAWLAALAIALGIAGWRGTSRRHERCDMPA